MKLCTSTNIMNFNLGKAYQVPLDVSLRECAAAGFEEVDPNFCGFSRPGQALAGEGWEKWVEDNRQLGDELNLKFSQAHAYWTIGNAFNPDMSRVDGEWGEELMRRSVLAAEAMGTKWMVVHPSSVLSYSMYDYKKSFAYNREYFKRWGEFYADHHVGMAIENMNRGSRFGTRPEELLELIDAIDNPMVQICIDTGHAHMAGVDVAEMIRMVGSHLKATHISDNHGERDEHVAPFNGTINWPEVMKALREIDYQECFEFEMHHLSSMYPVEVQPELVKFAYALGRYLMSL